MIKINQKTDCSGCYACYSVCPVKCITMTPDSEGFWYPVVDEAACTQCGACEAACHILNPYEPERSSQAYAAYTKKDEVIMASSSGGVFTPISEAIIDDGGVVFGAAFDEDFNVTHQKAENKADLSIFRGSKYVQSKIGDVLIEVKTYLKQRRTVLFSGTPCQIAGLRMYLKKKYENLITVDIICHGVPSPAVWDAYKKMRETDKKDTIKAVSFRDKTKGWNDFSLKMDFTSKPRYINAMDNDPYLYGFLRNLYLRPSCYDCVEKSLNRKSDVTLADYWGIEYVHPDFAHDKGVSLVFANTPNGKALLDRIKPELEWIETDLNKAAAQNIAATESAAMNPNRESFFEAVHEQPFKTVMKRYAVETAGVKIKKKTNHIIMQLKHAVKRIIGYNR